MAAPLENLRLNRMVRLWHCFWSCFLFFSSQYGKICKIMHKHYNVRFAVQSHQRTQYESKNAYLKRVKEVVICMPIAKLWKHCEITFWHILCNVYNTDKNTLKHILNRLFVAKATDVDNKYGTELDLTLYQGQILITQAWKKFKFSKSCKQIPTAGGHGLLKSSHQCMTIML